MENTSKDSLLGWVKEESAKRSSNSTNSPCKMRSTVRFGTVAADTGPEENDDARDCVADCTFASEVDAQGAGSFMAENESASLVVGLWGTGLVEFPVSCGKTGAISAKAEDTASRISAGISAESDTSREEFGWVVGVDDDEEEAVEGDSSS